jgi:nucleoid DNA-binding protein
LRPKKAKTFIPEVAEELNLSEKLVEDVIDFYWQEIRKSLSSLKHQRVHLTNLGDFVIKHWKIDSKIINLENWEENNKQKGMQQMTARFKTAENLFELKEIKKVIEEETQRKDFIKMHKKVANVSKTKHNKNLESKRSNTRRSNK